MVQTGAAVAKEAACGLAGARSESGVMGKGGGAIRGSMKVSPEAIKGGPRSGVYRLQLALLVGFGMLGPTRCWRPAVYQRQLGAKIQHACCCRISCTRSPGLPAR